uniref:Mos1 transposase HTH domain-containing protein n=1 Tax=Stegastes partitus TaxID=144197 RepID=A0A3B5AIW4_9TELE
LSNSYQLAAVRESRAFLVQLGKTPSEALGLLQQMYGDETMPRSRVECCKRFEGGHEDVEDDHRSGRPSMSRTEANVECVRQMMHGNRRLTMVLKLLTDDQKDRRTQVCQNILERLETEPYLLGRVITSDESWIFKTWRPEHSEEQSDVAKAEESKTVEVQSQSHVDRILQCEGHRPLRVLATGPDDDPAAFASLSE